MRIPALGNAFDRFRSSLISHPSKSARRHTKTMLLPSTPRCFQSDVERIRQLVRGRRKAKKTSRVVLRWSRALHRSADTRARAAAPVAAPTGLLIPHLARLNWKAVNLNRLGTDSPLPQTFRTLSELDRSTSSVCLSWRWVGEVVLSFHGAACKPLFSDQLAKKRSVSL